MPPTADTLNAPARARERRRAALAGLAVRNAGAAPRGTAPPEAPQNSSLTIEIPKVAAEPMWTPSSAQPSLQSYLAVRARAIEARTEAQRLSNSSPGPSSAAASGPESMALLQTFHTPTTPSGVPAATAKRRLWTSNTAQSLSLSLPAPMNSASPPPSSVESSAASPRRWISSAKARLTSSISPPSAPAAFTGSQADADALTDRILVYTVKAHQFARQCNLPPPLAGLANLGNTCYMNAVLQCLVNTDLVAGYFDNLHDDSGNDLASGGQLCRAFQQLVRAMRRADAETVSPAGLRSALSVHTRQFAGYEQHDAHEFCRTLLDLLHEDGAVQRSLAGKGLLIKGPFNEKRIDAMSNADKQQFRWNWFHANNQSIVTELYTGMYQSTVRCCKCKTESVVYDTFLDLALPIPSAPVARVRSPSRSGSALRAFGRSLKRSLDRRSPDSRLPDRRSRASSNASTSSLGSSAAGAALSQTGDLGAGALAGLTLDDSLGNAAGGTHESRIHLDDCLAAFTAQETLTGDSQYNCSRCKQPQDACKQLRLVVCPRLLIVQLKRFSQPHGLQTGRKLATPVVIPRTWSPRGLSEPVTYVLTGICNHVGSLYGGHYFAHIRAGAQWYVKNDARATPVALGGDDDGLSADAYLLFYERQP